MRKLLLLFMMSVTFIVPALAQQKQVHGVVQDAASHQPLPLATVTIKSNGVIKARKAADVDGKFIIEAETGSILTATYGGYKPKDITIGNADSTLVINLESSNTSLGEVVVIGYGKEKRTDLTSSVSSISAKEITEMPVTNLASALASRVPGLEIHGTGYAPGSGSAINVRGINSITQSEGPLFVVDGVALVGDIRSINPNDIESVEIL